MCYTVINPTMVQTAENTIGLDYVEEFSDDKRPLNYHY